MALRPTNLRAALRAAQAAEEGAPRLAMRSQADQARFVAEALKRPDNGWTDHYEFRIPGDVVRVGIGRGLDRREAQSIEWHFQSSKDAVKQFDDLYNSHPDVLTANDINPSPYSWAPRSSYAAYSEANRLRRSAESDVADALGLNGRPSLYGRIEPLPASETARLIRRVGATIKADADAFGPRSYRWTPVGGPEGSRAKLYRSMVADLPGYKYSPRDKLGDPGAVRQSGAPAPTGDWSTFPGVRGSIKDLPILAVPATAALGAGALAMQPGEAEAAPFGAAARVLDDGRMIGPKVTGYHGSTSPWLLAGVSPRFDTSAGLHVGDMAQANNFSGGSTLENLGRFSRDAATYVAEGVRSNLKGGYWPKEPELPMYRGKVTIKEGREIETPDFGDWLPRRWAKDIDKVKGLTPAEKDGLMTFLAEVDTNTGRYSTEPVRTYLADKLGVKRVRYKNDHEGATGNADNFSYIALSPDVAVTHSIPRQVAPYAAAGVAGTVLYPQDAGATSPQDSASSAVLGAISDRLRRNDGGDRAGQAGGPSALARAIARQLEGSFAQQQGAQGEQELGSMFDRVMRNEQRRQLQASGGRNDGTPYVSALAPEVGRFAAERIEPTGALSLYNQARDSLRERVEGGATPWQAISGATGDLAQSTATQGVENLAGLFGLVGQAPEAAYGAARAAPSALARALARKPQPRGSQTYRRGK